MQKIHVVNEFELMRLVKCPLYVARLDHSREPADSLAANAAGEDLLRWITRETGESDIPDLPDVRQRADALFRKHYTGAMTLQIAKRPIRMSRRLHDLVFFNDILYPETPYQLDLGPVRIEGSMTVVKSNGKGKASMPSRVIRLRNHKIEPPLMPDIVSMARWLYGQRESGYPSCVLYNYSLSGETTVNQQFTERVAQRWLTAAATNWLSSRLYPIPGDHCRDCQQPYRGLSENDPTSLISIAGHANPPRPSGTRG
jgi:hypothetical protein